MNQRLAVFGKGSGEESFCKRVSLRFPVLLQIDKKTEISPLGPYTLDGERELGQGIDYALEAIIPGT